MEREREKCLVLNHIFWDNPCDFCKHRDDGITCGKIINTKLQDEEVEQIQKQLRKMEFPVKEYIFITKES